MAYDKFYRFYDAVMGDRSAAASYIAELIDLYRPGTRTVLELACGTGSILGLLSQNYEVSGLDRSRKMLASARRKLPRTKLFCQNMTNFAVGQKFDAIVCVFDSINHLLRFSDWHKVFHRVRSHLKDEGIFVFDVNTAGKLRRLADGEPWVKQFGRDLVVITVTAGRRGCFNWNVKMFEHRQRNCYKLRAETIAELAVPMTRVTAHLRRIFKQVHVIDPETLRPTDRSQRLYFVCQK
jgi:SAM-dependent methyltransferase